MLLFEYGSIQRILDAQANVHLARLGAKEALNLSDRKSNKCDWIATDAVMEHS